MAKTTHSTVDKWGAPKIVHPHCIQEAMKLKYKITP